MGTWKENRWECRGLVCVGCMMVHGHGGEEGPLDHRGSLPASTTLCLHPIAPAQGVNYIPIPSAAPEGLTALGSQCCCKSSALWHYLG